jgi:hypothetical protein
MFDIFAQLNPVTLAIVIALIILSAAGALILRLVRKGATKPADLVNATKARIEQGKARKEAVKQAEAAIAEPVTSSRLSRIGARGNDEEVAAPGAWVTDAAAAETTEPFDLTTPETADDAGFAEQSGELATTPATPIEDEADDEAYLDAEADAVTDAEMDAEADTEVDAETGIDAAANGFAVHERPDSNSAFDFADPANHPKNWDELVAVINCLDQVLTRPWAEDRMTLQLSRDQLAASAAGDEAGTLALSRQLAATDLARTINSAAREQAAEVVAVVRDFAHQAPFNADECAAVMGGLRAIEWMALNPNGDMLEKRTLPLTVSAPEAPLWVEDAQTVVDRLRRDMAA